MLDGEEVFSERTVGGERFELGYPAIIGDPSVADGLADFSGQGRVGVQQPTPLGDAVGLVVEALGEDEVELGEHPFLEQARVQFGHAIGRMRADDGKVGHPHHLWRALLDEAHTR
ncbi:hypothetical protein SDC9_212879 [bioreactor metagenome]|uniref:Uncharacterized protein n=1 Tax=bioreactor metagenome TaxID=1076179 RepID=A0A645JPZ1_9ZZZZ